VYNGSDQSGSSMLEPSDREATLANMDIEWDLGFATLTSSTSTYEHEGDGWRDNTSLWVTGRDWFDAWYTGNPRPVAHVEAGFDEEAFVQEVRLVSNATDSDIDWTVGVYYMDQDREVTNFSYLLGIEEYGDACTALGAACPTGGQWWMGVAPMSEIDFYYIRQENFTDMSVYGDVTWHATDNLHLTLGLRWYDNELKNNTALDFPLFEGVEVPFEQYPTQNEDDVQYKINIAYDINESMMAYGTISEGFRRGGSNAIPKPVYYVDWQDPQLNTTTIWYGFFMAQNGESAATSGIELEAQYLLTDNLELSFGYGHVKAELTADLLHPQDGALVAEDGHRLPSTAENVASAALQHSFDMASGLNLTTRLSAYYQSDSINSVQDNSLQATFDAFSLWNFQTTLNSENWSAALFVKNIGDEQAVTGNYPAAYMSSDTNTFENFYGNNQRQYIATPRTIGVALKYFF
jgi:outer membrane receptor protein involved in Fe transport